MLKAQFMREPRAAWLDFSLEFYLMGSKFAYMKTKMLHCLTKTNIIGGRISCLFTYNETTKQETLYLEI